MKKRFLILSVFFLFLVSCAGLKVPKEELNSIPSRHVIKGIPAIAQGKNECGPTCLAMVMNYYGLDISKDEVWKYISPYTQGTPAEAMESYARSKGFKVDVLRDRSYKTIKYLLSKDYPLIVLGLTSWGSKHYRIIEGYDDNIEFFFFLDPSGGRRYRLPYESQHRFHSEYTGRAGTYYTLWIHPRDKKL